MEEEKEIGRIRLNESTEIVVRTTEYRGVSRLDIRKYVTSQKYTGWSPQGISIPLDKVNELKEFLKDVK